MRRWNINSLLLILAALSLIGCGNTASITSVNISEKDYGDRWPFLVSKGKLNCEGRSGFGAVTFTAQGITYAINGTAKALAKQRKGWKDIDEIWKSNPKLPGTKINISPIIEKGLSLCK